MRHSKADPPDSLATEEQLRQEIEELKQQIQAQKAGHAPPKLWHPSALTIWAIFLTVTVVLVIAFLAGYIPLRKRNALIRGEAQQQEEALPRVEVVAVTRSSRNSELELPGNIQASHGSPDSGPRRRLHQAAHGGHRRSGPHRPALGRNRSPGTRPAGPAGQGQSCPDAGRARPGARQLQQGKANMELARITADRWKTLAGKGVVSRQENDQNQAQYQAQVANVKALEKAISAQRSNIAAAQANLARLDEMQGYRVVKAPFDGVITLRNVDVGALVTTGSTLLFRIAQTGTLRTYVNVPQTNASSIRPGQLAQLSVSNLPGRRFHGTVARTANSLDPTTRTLLVEVQVPNADGALLPGMYAQVDLNSVRNNPPLMVPGDALIVRAEGTLVAVVRPDHTVHLQKIEVGRDYGDRLEVLSGLHEGDSIIPNPGESAREGVKVVPVPAQHE